MLNLTSGMCFQLSDHSASIDMCCRKSESPVEKSYEEKMNVGFINSHQIDRYTSLVKIILLTDASTALEVPNHFPHHMILAALMRLANFSIITYCPDSGKVLIGKKVKLTGQFYEHFTKSDSQNSTFGDCCMDYEFGNVSGCRMDYELDNVTEIDDAIFGAIRGAHIQGITLAELLNSFRPDWTAVTFFDQFINPLIVSGSISAISYDRFASTESLTYSSPIFSKMKGNDYVSNGIFRMWRYVDGKLNLNVLWECLQYVYSLITPPNISLVSEKICYPSKSFKSTF